MTATLNPNTLSTPEPDPLPGPDLILAPELQASASSFAVTVLGHAKRAFAWANGLGDMPKTGVNDPRVLQARMNAQNAVNTQVARSVIGR